jgi:hypothetical protein
MGALHKFWRKFNGDRPEDQASGEMLYDCLNAWAGSPEPDQDTTTKNRKWRREQAK